MRTLLKRLRRPYMEYLTKLQHFINYRINGLKDLGGLTMASRKASDLDGVIKLIKDSTFSANCDLGLFYKTKGRIKLLKKYTSCRGFVHDVLKQRMDTLKENGGALTLERQTSLYLVELGAARKLNVSARTLVRDFCETLNYKPPSWLSTPKHTVLKLDMNIFKNLYAVSLLFLIFKHSILTKKTSTLEEFIKAYWLKEDAQDRAIKAIRNWNKIFPRKTCTWKRMYGAGDINCLHNEGITELLEGKSIFEPIRIRANRILGGVDSCVVSKNPYGNLKYLIEGNVKNIQFQHRG